MNSGKQKLEEIYRSHHERGKRYGYLYCQGERGIYLNKWIGKGNNILDLGCRDGELTKYYAEGNKVLGVDIDRKALNIAESNLGISTLWVDLNTEFPFKEEDFDVIVACEIVEHIYHLETFIGNILASMKNGGIFIGSVPNSFRMRNRIKFLSGKEFESDPTHVRHFSYSNLEKLLNDNFKSYKIVPLGGKILPLIKVSQWTPYFLNKLFGRDLLFKAVK